MMIVADVRARVEAIARIKGDPEAQHIMADDLYRDVLRAIACGDASSPIQLAQATLAVEHIDFPRWSA